MRIDLLICAISTLLIAGCVGIMSESSVDADGIVYYLPKTLLKISVTRFHDTKEKRIWYQLGGFKPDTTEKHEFTDDIQVFETPDLEHRYVLNYRPSAFSDDRLCIVRGADGLLKEVSFAADDRTPQIAFNIGRLIGGFIGKSPVGVINKPATGDDPLERRSYTGTVDPFDPVSIAAFNRNMGRVLGWGVRIDLNRMKNMFNRFEEYAPQGCSFKDSHCSARAARKRCSKDHICYRTKVRLPIDLKMGGRRSGGKIVGGQTMDVQYPSVSHAGDMGAISVTRAFLVHKVTNLRFDQGNLTSTTIRKPSEVEEVSLLPLHVLNAILSTPTGLWSAAFANTDADKAAKLVEQYTKMNGQLSTLATNQKELYSAISGESVISSGVNAGIPLKTYGDCVTTGTGNHLNWIAAQQP